MLIWPHSHRQIACVQRHYFISCALCLQGENHGAAVAVVVAVAFAGVPHFVYIPGRQGDEAETVGEEFVGEDGGVVLDFDHVDCDGGDLSEHDAAKGVGEGEVDIGEDEVDGEGGGFADVDGWAGVGSVHVVVHDERSGG
jgi:hypothetical protein